MTVVSKVNLGEAGEPLVRDNRLDKVVTHLGRLVKFPDGIGFATKIEDAINSEDPAIPSQPDLAVFIVTSPHPLIGKSKVYKPEHLIISTGAMTLLQWRTADAEWRHYAHLSDPLRPIFAGLLRQHLAKRADLEALRG